MRPFFALLTIGISAALAIGMFGCAVWFGVWAWNGALAAMGW